jgi:2-polyprenyl-3-methyl-5-hydroxy-6-metoxy-1,4-benzoquinol methylase
MFDHNYNFFCQKRIKSIIDYYGYSFFAGKKVLDLGAGRGDIAVALARLGANVLCVDARQENLDIIQKNHPFLKTLKADLETEWPFENFSFDLVLSLDLICHLKNYHTHLINICKTGLCIVLETEVLDSSDPDLIITLFEEKSIPSLSFSGTSSIVSANNIQTKLKNLNATFKRVDETKMNSGPYTYDWVERGVARKFGNRRMYFIQSNGLSILKDEARDKIKEAEIQSNIPQIELPEVMSPIEMPQLSEKSLTEKEYSFKETGHTATRSLSVLRVALCLSGNLRTIQHVVPSWQKYLLNKKNIHIDWFVHTWDKANHTSTESSQPLIDFLKQFNVKDISVEEKKTFHHTRLVLSRANGYNPQSTYSQFYSLQKVFELKKKYENENNFRYDCAIRFRPDIQLNQEFPINSDLDFNKIYIPKWGDYHGINDQVAF